MLLRCFIIFLCMCLFACKDKYRTKVEKAFYYWKNIPNQLTHEEFVQLEKDSVRKLYVKFFEVEPDKMMGSVPTAKTNLRFNYGYSNEEDDSLQQEVCKHLKIIPTVYIRNSVFKDQSKGSLDTLADNIVFLINKYYEDRYRMLNKYTEIQIDCDWTPSTKNDYFYLLKKIKQLSGKTLSATLRLYPYKYLDKMGVLPVDKAMLMCYNLGSPLSHENENSIIETDVLKSYVKNVKKYPVHTDIALPVFSWMLWYQNNRFAGMVYATQYANLRQVLKEIKPLWYVVEKDIVVDDIFLKAGDKIKLEEANDKTLHESIETLQKYVPMDDSTTISLFHLDDQNLKKYSNEAISSFYSDFTK